MLVKPFQDWLHCLWKLLSWILRVDIANLHATNHTSEYSMGKLTSSSKISHDKVSIRAEKASSAINANRKAYLIFKFVSKVADPPPCQSFPITFLSTCKQCLYNHNACFL